jgi:diaminopimelate decarboxylase
MVDRVRAAGHDIVEVNAGGGLGVPQAAGESPLDVDAYAALLVRHLGDRAATIACEPGDFLCKESAVLLAEVVSLDERDGTIFAGLDAGYNVAPERFIYGALVPVVLCRAAGAEPDRTYTVAGNINEGDDLWGEEIALPGLREGDVVVLLGVGTYNRSMHLDHTLRPPAPAVVFADRL